MGSPNARAWLKFKSETAAVPYEWTDIHKAAFDAGARHGIDFCLSQLAHDLERIDNMITADTEGK
jgi:hypothetical protein